MTVPWPVRCPSILGSFQKLPQLLATLLNMISQGICFLFIPNHSFKLSKRNLCILIIVWISGKVIKRINNSLYTVCILFPEIAEHVPRRYHFFFFLQNECTILFGLKWKWFVPRSILFSTYIKKWLKIHRCHSENSFRVVRCPEKSLTRSWTRSRDQGITGHARWTARPACLLDATQDANAAFKQLLLCVILRVVNVTSLHCHWYRSSIQKPLFFRWSVFILSSWYAKQVQHGKDRSVKYTRSKWEDERLPGVRRLERAPSLIFEIFFVSLL
jgi:hypothetical protein